MRALFYLVFSLFVFPISNGNLYASTDAFDSAPQTASLSVASSEGLPSNLVADCVCVITGEYVENEIDFTVQGPEPLSFQRLYSSNVDRTSFGGYWSNNYQDCVMILPFEKEGFKYKKIILKQPSNAYVSYQISSIKLNNAEENKIPFKFDVPKGLTNSSFSGRGNLKNQKAFFCRAEDREDNTILIENPLGDRLIFKSSKKDKLTIGK